MGDGVGGLGLEGTAGTRDPALPTRDGGEPRSAQPQLCFNI